MQELQILISNNKHYKTNKRSRFTSFLQMKLLELFRKWKRILQNYFTCKRTLLLILVIGGLLYIGPNPFGWFFQSKLNIEDLAERCLKDRLLTFYFEAEEFNANIRHVPVQAGEKPYLAFVGNGVFGFQVEDSSPIYIRSGNARSLSLPVQWHPIVSMRQNMESGQLHEATVVQYLSGIVYKYQCFSSGLHVSYKYLAHRALPNVLVQNIEIGNPTNESFVLNVEQLKYSNSHTPEFHITKFEHEFGGQEYQVFTGMIEVPSTVDVIAVCIVSKSLPKSLEIKPRSTAILQVLTTISYSEPTMKSEYEIKRNIVERQSLELMGEALAHAGRQSFINDHIDIWQQLWSTGISISYSKAADAINGDKINATIYYILSQVRSPDHEEATSNQKKAELANSLSYTEGCYDGIITLKAPNLWTELSSIEDVNSVVSLWLLTLEKQGCHNLLKAGASGVMQAIVLSLGAFRFRNQHLEFNIHPKYLHRDYSFKRLNYGNLTHVNVSVVLQDDNKAVLYVALDRSDKSYYACNGGCLDGPVHLGPQKKMFPVKLTEPLTAILYITHDKQHMEDLRHTIHVKEIVEAPAHKHHVIALHKHGHALGGLPILFWVSICFLIVVFHLFIFNLVYNEFCGQQADKYRIRYKL